MNRTRQGDRLDVRALWTALAFALGMSLIVGCHDSSSASTSSAASAVPTMGALEAGTNRQGRDLSDFGVRAADAPTCARLCAAEAQCKAMSFLARPSPDEGICYLKGSVPEPSPNPATVSSVKVAP